MQSHLWRLGGAWLYSQTAINHCFSKLDSWAHTIPSATLFFLSVHSTEEAKGNSECVLRASKNSRNVKLLLPIRMRSVCAVIGWGTQSDKGCVSFQQLLLLLMQINHNTIAVHYFWESFPNVSFVVRCLGGFKSGSVMSASSSDPTRCSRITRIFL